MTKPFRLLASLTLIGALAACGGGGDAGTPPTSPTTPTGTVRSDFALVATSPSTTYGASGAQDVIHSRLNALRLAVGAGALTQSTALDTAAAGHLGYMSAHWPHTSHDQTQGQAAFTGATPAARATAAGYAGVVSEDLAATTASSPAECLETLMDSVYHQVSLLGEHRDIGIAYGEVTQGLYGCVIELGVGGDAYAQRQDTGVLKAYPYAGQTGVNTTFVPVTEQPNPMPDVGGNFVGHPILASMRAYGATGSFSVTSFTLKDGAGNLVPARIIANSAVTGTGLTVDPQAILGAGDVYLVPLSELLAGTTYTVEFVGANGAQAYTKTWTFTTR